MKTITLSPQAMHCGSLILVNACYPYREEQTDKALMPMDCFDPAVLLERQSAGILTKLLSELGAQGQIAAVSGWRSKTQQTQIYNDSLAENGPDFTRKYVALPGHSEHQTGLAIDLAKNKPDIDFLRPDFPYRGICQKFRDRAPGFGFVERYPKSKEKVTGIAWEPWHFRYVGFPHAEIMHQRGFSLEEYHDFLKDYPYGRRPFLYEAGARQIEISYLEKSGSEDTLVGIDDNVPCLISGNNVDGFIVTRWRGTNG